MNEKERCTCKKDFGSTESVDRENFPQPVQVKRCNECNGILEMYNLW
jgi:hypothetical protein